MGDPTYVRLTDRLATGGSWSDLDSGFAIGGFDVKKFPKDDTRAADAVRSAVRAGILEEASKAEFDEVEAAHAVVTELPERQRAHQEGALRLQADETRRKIQKRRTAAPEPEEEPDVDDDDLDDEDEDDDEPDDNYDEMTNAELKEEIEKRDGVSLPSKVNKRTLIETLRADDATRDRGGQPGI